MIYDAVVDGRTLRVEVRGQHGRFSVTLDGETLDVDYQETSRDFVSLLVAGRSYEVGLSRQAGGQCVAFRDAELLVELSPATRDSAPVSRKPSAGPVRVTAPMPGKIVRLLVEEGQQVAADQGLVVVEAMKMENELRAPRAGRVRERCVREGQAVEMGAVLVVVE